MLAIYLAIGLELGTAWWSEWLSVFGMYILCIMWYNNIIWLHATGSSCILLFHVTYHALQLYNYQAHIWNWRTDKEVHIGGIYFVPLPVIIKFAHHWTVPYRIDRGKFYTDHHKPMNLIVIWNTVADWLVVTTCMCPRDAFIRPQSIKANRQVAKDLW